MTEGAPVPAGMGDTRTGRWSLVLLLALAGCAPAPAPVARATLLDIARLEPGIRLDIRYATEHNFTGHPLYPAARAFLLPEAAHALVRVHRALAVSGHGLLIYDAYRPWSVTGDLWAAASPTERARGYVADPAIGSRHNRGCAVDAGLYDLATGRELAMPSDFDEFSIRARADWPGGGERTRAHRNELRRAMEAEGFAVLANEWWHFNYRGCDRHPLLDIPFDALATSLPAAAPGGGRHPT